MDLERLSEPFHSSQIHWRVGSTTGDKSKGMALAYLDARDVMDRLDKVCGLHGWQSDHPWSDGKKLNCRIGIKVGDEWIWKSDGAGETAVEGDKGAFSDALKRAAVSWDIGRYLYTCPNWWAELTPAGRSYKFNDAAIKELNSKMDNWLLPRRKTKFVDAYNHNRVAVDSMIDAIVAGEYGPANSCWKSISEADQASLWLAPTNGGLLDQSTKTIIRSTEFQTAKEIK
jgi:hypothetical protein